VKETATMKLQALRKEMRITQAQAAEWIGCPLRTYQKWEQGIATPPGWNLKLIIEKLEKYKEKQMDAQKIAEKLRNGDQWDMDLLKELCDLAGLSDEWKDADGDTFETVAYKAADILGVEIV